MTDILQQDGKISLGYIPIPMMVLDPKSGGTHNDYGSIAGDKDVAGAEATSGTSGGPPVAMTQSDLYQRQPLLPSETVTWATKNGGSAGTHHNSSIMVTLSEDNDDDTDGLKRNAINSNGIVRIEVPSPLREEPRFPKEKFKTFLAFVILAINFVLTTTSLALVHERLPDRDKYKPLPDVFLDNVPSATWALDISEILIMIFTTITFLVLVMHKHRFIIFRRIFLILALLYLMRSITMYVTVLPMSSNDYYCSPKANATTFLTIAKRVFQLMSGFGLTINGKHTFCGDYIYSGHTVILVMCYLIIQEYSPKRFWPLHWASLICSGFGVVMVLVARGHYTVDVVIAYYVTTRVFWMYHTMANNAILKNAAPNNFLSRMWWFRLFRYFEGNVGGPVPRQHDCPLPLPWPRRFLAKHPNRDS
uniref:Sphingomyelin synthase-like domain-containing protein n=1 Tax=Clastoptera arizonana TaxID=38151 RepID=A0A1B6E5A4_9HEMI